MNGHGPSAEKGPGRPEVSLVIPVYNVAAHLRQCLDSFAGQAGCAFEALCVDDGSTDGSGAVLDEYAARDARFRVLHQANGGTHVARKRAVLSAAGAWCLFLDPDDWLEPDALARLAPVLGAASGVDVVCPGVAVHVCEGTKGSFGPRHERLFSPPPRKYSRDDLFEAAFVARTMSAHLIGKVVRTETCRRAFAALSDRRIVFQEDILAFYRIVAESSGAEGLSGRFYNYRVGPGISYRPFMTPDEFFGSFAKFEELADLKRFRAGRFPDGSPAAAALGCLEVRLAVATLSEAMERLESPADGRAGVDRLRAACPVEVVAAACAEWHRLKGVQLADAAHRFGLEDILGDVALRQLDYVWRGHNDRLRALGEALAAVRRELAAVRRELAAERDARARLEANVRHPVRALLRKIFKIGGKK